MAKFAILAEYVNLNATDLSNYVKSAQFTYEADAQDSTTMGSGGAQENLAGLRSGSLDITFADDVAASALDSILWAIFATVVTFEIRGTNAARGTSNPAFTGNVLINTHPFGGDLGNLATKQVKYPTSGPVLRATS